MSETELVEIGRRIYQTGKLADGTPSKAYVLGNVAVSGDQFTCVSCHRRSGMGGSEGTKFVLPTNGTSLATPRVDLYMERPAYTLESFSAAMTIGVNPNGEQFDPVMPKYELSGLDAKALFTYLQTLSSVYSQGMTEEAIHIATVVEKGVDPIARKEMLTVIKAFFDNKVAQTRKEQRRRQTGVFYQAYRAKAYRHWIHHVWEVSGPSSSWIAQLEELYQQQPVFALLSGMVNGSWQPIHDFCRDKKLISLLPNTDLPKIAVPVDYYTLYYSSGIDLESRVVFADISSQQRAMNILQLTSQGLVARKGARTVHDLAADQSGEIVESVLDLYDIDWKAVRQKIDLLQPGAIVLWLDEPDLHQFADKVGTYVATIPVYISSTLLNGDLTVIPEVFEKSGRIIHPYILPENHSDRFFLVSAWLRNNQIELTNPIIQGQTHYACLLLNSGLGHIKQYYYREYLFDMLDHGDNMAPYSGVYPRLSFGPKQRFLSKGAYIIDLKKNSSRWIVPGNMSSVP